jgi:hypothetical protein
VSVEKDLHLVDAAHEAERRMPTLGKHNLQNLRARLNRGHWR